MNSRSDESGRFSARRCGAKLMPQEEYLIKDPVIIVSQNFTYYAPEEKMAVPLRRPTIITFGSAPAEPLQTHLPRIHLILPERVHDRLEANAECTVQKRVQVAPLHGAIIFRDARIYYKHLSDSPTVVAERILDATPIDKPSVVVQLHRGQTIGLGMTTDAFGGILWWYYLRVYSLQQLRRSVR